MSIMHFSCTTMLGTAATPGTVGFANHDVMTSYYSDETQYAGIQLNANGRVYQSFGILSTWYLINTGAWANYWLTDDTNYSDFSVRATVTAGSFAGASEGTLNTWQNLGTTRSWRFGPEMNSVRDVTLLIEIRRDSTGTVEASGSVRLQYDPYG